MAERLEAIAKQMIEQWEAAGYTEIKELVTEAKKELLDILS